MRSSTISDHLLVWRIVTFFDFLNLPICLDISIRFCNISIRDLSNPSISTLNDSNFAFCDKNDKLQNQLRQILGSWSDHVKSWTEQTKIPVHVVRYEDMVNSTFDSFSKAVKFIWVLCGTVLKKIINIAMFNIIPTFIK